MSFSGSSEGERGGGGTMGRCFWVGGWWTTGDFVACSVLRLSPCPRFPPPAVILLLSPLPPVFRALGSPDRRGMQERRRRRKACGKVLTFHRPFPPSLRHTSLLPFFSSNKWGIYIFGWRAPPPPPPPPPEFGGGGLDVRQEASSFLSQLHVHCTCWGNSCSTSFSYSFGPCMAGLGRPCTSSPFPHSLATYSTRLLPTAAVGTDAKALLLLPPSPLFLLRCADFCSSSSSFFFSWPSLSPVPSRRTQSRPCLPLKAGQIQVSCGKQCQ